MKIINFLDIYCSLIAVSPNLQISYLTKSEIIKNLNFPIKESDTEEIKTTKDELLHISEKAICLITIEENGPSLATGKCQITFEILNKIKGIKIKKFNYLNKKFAAVMAGLGQYGKNQLIYNQTFGFNISINTFIIYNDVINLPIRESPNYNILSLCDGCNLCAINCPAKAIHIEENGPHWLDANACRKFYMYGDHPVIPSAKYGINTFLNNKYSEEELLKVTDYKSFEELFGFPDRENCIEIDGEKYQISIDFCKECTNQLPCRKQEYIYYKDKIRVEKFDF